MSDVLTLKKVGIETRGENVAFLSSRCGVYKPENFNSVAKVEIESADPAHAGRRILATLNIVENGAILGRDCLGLSISAFAYLGVPEGTAVTLRPVSPPHSLDYVRKKIGGETLAAAEIGEIIRDLVMHRYSKTEIAAFLVACAAKQSPDEVLAMTRAMADVGNKLTWDVPIIADKHCIGGIPGNRTSMIVVPIVAAHGLPIPKTSSRAITSPAGTADTMATLANVDIGVARLQEIVRNHGGCLVWGGQANLSPADDIMITVERPLGIDTPEQLVASILSKKIAAGATHLLIDMPVGPTAKIRSAANAAQLRKLFEYVGAAVGLVMKIAVTDGSQPIGRGIGPVLEARDAIAVLRNEAQAPADLRDRALFLAGEILEFDERVQPGAGYWHARELLESGAARKKMDEIIEAQGPPSTRSVLGELTQEVCANSDGKVAAIDCYRIARIARLAGAPASSGAGIDLFKKAGDSVRQGDPLYRIHSAVRTDFDFAREMAAENGGYSIA